MLVAPRGKLSNRGQGNCRLKCGASRLPERSNISSMPLALAYERAKICCAHDHLISLPIRRGRCRQEQSLAESASVFEGSPPDVIWRPTACQT
jgi:hypothetical protein